MVRQQSHPTSSEGHQAGCAMPIALGFAQVEWPDCSSVASHGVSQCVAELHIVFGSPLLSSIGTESIATTASAACHHTLQNLTKPKFTKQHVKHGPTGTAWHWLLATAPTTFANCTLTETSAKPASMVQQSSQCGHVSRFLRMTRPTRSGGMHN